MRDAPVDLASNEQPSDTRDWQADDPKEKHGNHLRRVIVYALLGILVSVSACVIWLVFKGQVEDAKTLVTILMTPFLSVFSAALGFYFAKAR